MGAKSSALSHAQTLAMRAKSSYIGRRVKREACVHGIWVAEHNPALHTILGRASCGISGGERGPGGSAEEITNLKSKP